LSILIPAIRIATPPGGTLKTYTVREEYLFDFAGRLKFTRHKINANSWVITAAPLYDEMGRINDKRLQVSNYDGMSTITPALIANFTYLQSIDYTYNIRGWLTAMNAPTSCSVQSGDQLADLFSMSLDYESTANGASPQYNGNIASMQWRTNLSTCLPQQQYRFTYDFANRLLTANHYTHNGSTWTNTNNYSESGIIYDQNGNIKNYTRRGLVTAPSNYGVIDQLTYTYGDVLRPDRLTNMVDAGSANKGFMYTPAAAAYQYDANGNMTQDNHKGFAFGYNFLNLPQTMTKGANVITMTYTADGEKLTKAITGGATKNYVGGIEYSGSNLEAIYFSEGRCTPNGATAFYYDYTIKDHLGNARLNFRANGAAVTFLEDMHYYPFGMQIEGLGTQNPVNKYQFNGIERQDNFSINIDLAFFRGYDPAIGRWWQVDPRPSADMSVYTGMGNNPLRYADQLGDTLRGVSSVSAQREESIIRGSFGSSPAAEATASLFSVGADGKTFKAISRRSFNKATKGLSRHAKALAIGYYKAVNSESTHVVEVLKRSEPLSDYGKKHFQNYQKGSNVDDDNSGGVTFSGSASYQKGINNDVTGNSTYSVFVLDSNNPLSDGHISPPGELSAHEILGHGIAMSMGFIEHSLEAIQATNIYNRSVNMPTPYQRKDHGASKINGNPNGVPFYLNPNNFDIEETWKY